MKSEHPAVVRAKPRISSTFSTASQTFGSLSPAGLSFPQGPNSHSQGPRPFRHQPDSQDVLPSYNEYIIPIPDPKPDEVFTDADIPSENPERYTVCQKMLLHTRLVPSAGLAKRMRICFLNVNDFSFSNLTPPHPDVLQAQ